MQIAGTTVFITGTSRGIGKALVEAALKFNAKKVYAAVRDLSTAPVFNDPRVQMVELDITNEQQMKKAAELASDTQILINNAGSLKPGNILQSDFASIEHDMNVNYLSTIKMMRAFVPVLEKNQGSRIVNIASIAVYSNFPFIAGYSASKAALYSATQAARIELSKKSIAVHAVNPGAIDTDMNKGSTLDMTSPADVAQSILEEVEKETLDIIPDKIGKGMYAMWKESPALLEEAASNWYHGK